MCEKCNEAWAKYKQAEGNLAKLKEIYMRESKDLCDDKKSKPASPAEPKRYASELEKLMDENGFCESQNKPGLWFNKLGENHVVFIDTRSGTPRSYGLKDGQNMPHEDVHEITKGVTETLKMNERKKAGQTGLDEKFF